MIRPPPRSTRTDTRFPYTTLVRSVSAMDLLRVTAMRLPSMTRYSPSWPASWSQRPCTESKLSRWERVAASPPGSLICTNSRRSEEHTSELQSLMRNSYAVFCLKKKTHVMDDTDHVMQLRKQA